MHGAVTNTVSSVGRDFKALLDVSRLVSRVGYGPHTGVDRVELAYLEWCLSTEETFYGLVRVAGGIALLDRNGLHEVHGRLTGKTPWGARDIRGLIGLKTPSLRARAESDVRRLAIEFGKEPVFSSTFLSELTYLNIGHSNLRQNTLEAVSHQVNSVAVFIHDFIPLEYPEFQEPNSVDIFCEKIGIVSSFADLIIFNSNDTQNRSAPFVPRNQKTVVSHLGIDTPTTPKSNSSINRPYFVAIGTIEPRKNHKLLLDVWADIQSSTREPDIPHLHIVGRRGWKNEDVFAQLDETKSYGHLTEHNDLNDADMWTLLAGANALLFPSIAEGFGLPSLEAAALGVPVICGDLAIHRELLGAYPVYVDLQDPYLWKKTILEQTQEEHQTPRPAPHIPSWDEHFARVNHAITEKR